jgi:uncharacterized protein YdbL (DUF1318 family)
MSVGALGALAISTAGVYRLTMDVAALLQQVGETVTGTAQRVTKAARAAEVIRRAGGNRWVGVYDVTDQQVVNLAWSGPAPLPIRSSR